jgi:hypothetical protein
LAPSLPPADCARARLRQEQTNNKQIILARRVEFVRNAAEAVLR